MVVSKRPLRHLSETAVHRLEHIMIRLSSIDPLQSLSTPSHVSAPTLGSATHPRAKQ